MESSGGLDVKRLSMMQNKLQEYEKIIHDLRENNSKLVDKLKQ